MYISFFLNIMAIGHEKHPLFSIGKIYIYIYKFKIYSYCKCRLTYVYKWLWLKIWMPKGPQKVVIVSI